MDIKDTFIKVLEWVGHNPLRLIILLVIGLFVHLLRQGASHFEL